MGERGGWEVREGGRLGKVGERGRWEVREGGREGRVGGYELHSIALLSTVTKLTSPQTVRGGEGRERGGRVGG